MPIALSSLLKSSFNKAALVVAFKPLMTEALPLVRVYPKPSMVWKVWAVSTSIDAYVLLVVPKESVVFCFFNKTLWSPLVSQKSTSLVVGAGGGGVGVGSPPLVPVVLLQLELLTNKNKPETMLKTSICLMNFTMLGILNLKDRSYLKKMQEYAYELRTANCWFTPKRQKAAI